MRSTVIEVAKVHVCELGEKAAFKDLIREGGVFAAQYFESVMFSKPPRKKVHNCLNRQRVSPHSRYHQTRLRFVMVVLCEVGRCLISRPHHHQVLREKPAALQDSQEIADSQKLSKDL
jgi:hypothetical protein